MTKRNFNLGDSECRMRQAFRRLGTDKPRCPVCGETDWRCMDLDHVAGQEFDHLKTMICANCHRKKSDATKDHPQRTTSEPPNMLERIGHMLLGLVEWFSLIAESLRAFGLYLIRLAETAQPYASAEQLP